MGIGSGEGLIEQVGDTPDLPDKRLLLRLGELSRALKQGRREGSTLSEILREAWDGKRLSIANRKQNALSATGYAVSVVGDITPTVLPKLLAKGTEGEDGWANRFLWCCLRSVRDIPSGGNMNVLDAFLPRLDAAIAFGKTVGEMQRDAQADARWNAVYGELKRSGDVVPHTDRARPYVMRLAMLYAVADLSRSICLPHLEAALDIWGYCLESARELFSSATGDNPEPPHSRLLRLAKSRSDGITKTDAFRLFSNKRDKDLLNTDFALLTPAFGDWRSGRWFAMEFLRESDMGGVVVGGKNAVCVSASSEQANAVERGSL
jgi:hypothetical protein